jgi:glycosyltransferase involved in cell wall biosynthesis
VKYIAYKWTIGSAIARAKHVIAVSEFTKNDILAQYKNTEEKISVTYEACDDLCRISNSPPHHILEKYGIIKPYLLYVGNAYPHKNLQCLIDAFALISSTFPEMQLALVGKEDYFYARLKAYCSKKNIKGVHFLGFVSDQDLDVLYRFTKAYVFPSLYEGFGLPPLEAMAKGAVVVSSDHPCMQEVLGDAAWYCDARASRNITQGIVKVLNDDILRIKLVEKGYQQIKKYSWDKMANETLEIYKKT